VGRRVVEEDSNIVNGGLEEPVHTIPFIVTPFLFNEVFTFAEVELELLE